MATAEARLDVALPLHEKFEKSERSAESEARVRPLLDRVFGTNVGELSLYGIECHDVVCRLETRVSMNDWQEALFADVDGIGLFSSMQVGDDTSYLRLEAPARVAGIQYFVKLAMALEASPALAGCKQSNPTKGVVKLALRLEPSTRQVAVDATGSLANQSGGVCIRKVMEELVSANPPPGDPVEIPDEPYEVGVP